MSTEAKHELREQSMKRPQMDWQQVVLNGGPPCFAVLGDQDTQYCGRAERWAGHGTHHDFVSLDALLDRAEADALKGICLYCGEIQQYDSLEQKNGPEGNQIRIAHVERCDKRPEKKLIAFADGLENALNAALHAMRSYQSGNASPDLADEVEAFAKAALAVAQETK